MQNKKCPGCGLINFSKAVNCKRCGFSLAEKSDGAVPAVTLTNNKNHLRGDVNEAGWKKIKSGALITGIYIVILVIIAVSGSQIKINPFAVVTGLAPVAWLLAGVLEIVTGVPFSEMAQKWDDLAGWQRGAIGISVFVDGLILLGIVCFLILVALDTSQGIQRKAW
jgi:hypothetical protein